MFEMVEIGDDHLWQNFKPMLLSRPKDRYTESCLSTARLLNLTEEELVKLAIAAGNDFTEHLKVHLGSESFLSFQQTLQAYHFYRNLFQWRNIRDKETRLTVIFSTAFYGLEDVTVYSPNTGVADGSAASAHLVSVYPNPASDALMITGTTLGLAATLCDATGRNVRQVNMGDASNTMVIADLPAGAYTLQLIGSGYSSTHRITIAR